MLKGNSRVHMFQVHLDYKHVMHINHNVLIYVCAFMFVKLADVDCTATNLHYLSKISVGTL